MFFNLQHIKAIAASIFIMQQVLSVCRKLQQLLNLQQKLLKIAATPKIAACPLWAAVGI